MSDDSWRTATFRQSVVSKIDEAIRQSRTPTTRNSMEMENHVFQKAKTKEEYLGFTARLILHLREISRNDLTEEMAAQLSGQSGGQQPGQSTISTTAQISEQLPNQLQEQLKIEMQEQVNSAAPNNINENQL